MAYNCMQLCIWTPVLHFNLLLVSSRSEILDLEDRVRVIPVILLSHGHASYNYTLLSQQLLPVERPNFTEIITHLIVVIEDLDDLNGRGSINGGYNIEPQPRNRLSYLDLRSRSRSCSLSGSDLNNSRETTV